MEIMEKEKGATWEEGRRRQESTRNLSRFSARARIAIHLLHVKPKICLGGPDSRCSSRSAHLTHILDKTEGNVELQNRYCVAINAETVPKARLSIRLSLLRTANPSFELKD